MILLLNKVKKTISALLIALCLSSAPKMESAQTSSFLKSTSGTLGLMLGACTMYSLLHALIPKSHPLIDSATRWNYGLKHLTATLVPFGLATACTYGSPNPWRWTLYGAALMAIIQTLRHIEEKTDTTKNTPDYCWNEQEAITVKALSPDEQYIAGVCKNELIIRSLNGTECYSKQFTKGEAIKFIQFTPDNKQLVVGTVSKITCIHRYGGSPSEFRLDTYGSGEEAPADALVTHAITDGGKNIRVARVLKNKKVQIHDLDYATPKMREHTLSYNDEIVSIQLSKNGKFLMATLKNDQGQGHKIDLTDLRSTNGETKSIIFTSSPDVTCTHLSDQGNYLATVCSDGKVTVTKVDWKNNGAELITELPDHQNATCSISPDERYLYIRDSDGYHVEIRTISNQEEYSRHPDLNKDANTKFSPDGSYYTTMRIDDTPNANTLTSKTVVVHPSFDKKGAQELHFAHQEPVDAVLPGEDHLITISNKGTKVSVYNLNT